MTRMACHLMVTFFMTLKSIGHLMKTVCGGSIGIFFQLLMMPYRIKSLGNSLTLITKTIMAIMLDSQGIPLLMMDISINNGMFGINLFGVCIMDNSMLPFMLVYDVETNACENCTPGDY